MTTSEERLRGHMTEQMRRLLLGAMADGVTSDYGFAEWLVGEKQHFGPMESMDETDLESAWMEAMNWWRMYVTPPRQVSDNTGEGGEGDG